MARWKLRLEERAEAEARAAFLWYLLAIRAQPKTSKQRSKNASAALLPSLRASKYSSAEFAVDSSYIASRTPSCTGSLETKSK